MASNQRTIGLIGATGVGIGAIVGGGIFVLAGVAYAATGPGAVVAFALNGLIAVITALSFAEMSSAFPESGGSYAFARRVLSVKAAFASGWILWFAYIVAGVLYALGFASYAGEFVRGIWLELGSSPPAWVSGRLLGVLIAIGSVGLYTIALTRKAEGGGQMATVGKLVVFVVLLVAGAWAVVSAPLEQTRTNLTPFMPWGSAGLVAAMGFTFIAVQGFDLISAIAGEVKKPKRTIPLAMLLSLGVAMAIYLPLLVIVAAVGVTPGQTVGELSTAYPETMMAIAAEQFMGRTGYWLVVVAAILSTLSALSANFMAASRVAQRMAQDRTLPAGFELEHPERKTPVAAVQATAVAIIALVVLLPDLSAAGAAASLIFLISFALAHITCYLARVRGSAEQDGFLMPFFPFIPFLGAAVCGGLALFQAVVVPAAGVVAGVWLALGFVLYTTIFSRRAEVLDAFAEARDPTLMRLRGRSSLVLVPVANPANAGALVAVANAVAPPQVGRVLLLSVVRSDGSIDGDEPPPALLSTQDSLARAVTMSLGEGQAPEALMTVATEPWTEIARVAEEHECASVLLGFGDVPEGQTGSELERMLGRVDCDVLVLRSPVGWHPRDVRRILVPIGGRGGHDALRARLLSSLNRSTVCETTFLQCVPVSTTDEEVADAERKLSHFGREEVGSRVNAQVIRTEEVTATIAQWAAHSELVIMGMHRVGRRKVFGALALRLARESEAATLMIGRGQSSSMWRRIESGRMKPPGATE